MKPPIKNVELSFACPERWENLIDVGANKFCEKCQHVVVDFTRLSQEEFKDALKNNPGRLCGRFKSTQMKTPLFKYIAASAITLSVLAPTSCTEEVVLPADKAAPEVQDPIHTPNLIENAGLDHKVVYTTGIVLVDSLNEVDDTTNSIRVELPNE